MNNPASGKTYILNGKGYKSVIDLSGQTIIDCYIVNGGWSINPLAGQPTAVNMPAGTGKNGSDCHWTQQVLCIIMHQKEVRWNYWVKKI